MMICFYGGLSRLSLCDNLVRNVGLEPTRRMTPDSKSGAAASYANSAYSKVIFMY